MGAGVRDAFPPPDVLCSCIHSFAYGNAATRTFGRAHRHRPYPSPSYFSTQSYTNKITIYTQSTQTTSTAPTHLHQTTRCVHTPPYCTFDSSKPRGVPLPHRGYTFDSAGLASATQPTLGNDVRDEATPLGGCTFSTTLLFNVLPPHTHRGGNASRTPAPIL